MSAPGPLTDLVLRPLNDLATGVWRLERRTEFLYRDRFDRALRDPLFAAAQALLNATRRNEGLGLAEERPLPGEEQLTDGIIADITAFVRDTWQPGGAQRFGQTKTIGLVRGELTVPSGLPGHLRHGIFATPGSYRAWVRFSGPGPYAPPDLDDFGQCCVAIKLMGVPGPKLLDDEQRTQDLLLVSPQSFISGDVRENRRLQRHARARTGLFYFLDPGDPQLLLAALMQVLDSRVHSSPLEVRYFSCVPFLLGDGQAVQYSLRPRSAQRTRIPARPSANYLREAMARTLARGDWTFDLTVQPQTDPHRMPIEDAKVKWPERLSPYVPVAQLRLPAQRFDSDEQLAFADKLAFNPWHSRPEHRPLGSQNRARGRIYRELAELRRSMNVTEHVEPTGDEAFPGSPPPSGPREAGEVARRTNARQEEVGAAAHADE